MPAAPSAATGGGTVAASPDNAFDSAFVLHVDKYSAALSQLFAAFGHRCAAFITACNPLSMPHGHEENLAACARLRDRLMHYCARPEEIIDGESSDSIGTWPGEKSFLVLGLDLETAIRLGREFRQNALVWADEDAIPRLILLR
jgi:hypothetical protein